MKDTKKLAKLAADQQRETVETIRQTRTNSQSEKIERSRPVTVQLRYGKPRKNAATLLAKLGTKETVSLAKEG